SDPTDKSIPAVRITKVIPNAISALMDTCRNKLRILSSVKKLGLNTPNMATIKISSRSGPIFAKLLTIKRFIIIHLLLQLSSLSPDLHLLYQTSLQGFLHG